MNICYILIFTFKSTWNFDKVILLGLFSTLVASLMTYLPIKRVLKISIIDTLGFE